MKLKRKCTNTHAVCDTAVHFGQYASKYLTLVAASPACARRHQGWLAKPAALHGDDPGCSSHSTRDRATATLSATHCVESHSTLTTWNENNCARTFMCTREASAFPVGTQYTRMRAERPWQSSCDGNDVAWPPPSNCRWWYCMSSRRC